MVRIDLTLLRGSGDWTLSIADGASRPERASIDSEHIDRALRLARSLESGGGFAADDSLVSAQEEALGRALTDILRQGPPRFWRLLGRAEAEGSPAALVVDAPELRALPWELIAGDDGQALEATGRAVVVRAATPADQSQTLGQGIAWWSPTPDDPVCASRLSGPDRDQPAVLHVVCHGRADAQRMVVELEDEDMASSTLGHSLRPRLASSSLLILEVCEAAHPAPADGETLAGRVVAAGAGACLAPAAELALEAADAMSRALHRAFASGATVLAAVAEARRAVRERALPHRDGRWHNLQLHCGRYEALAVRPMLPSPEGLRASASELRPLIDQAIGLAHRDALGYLGFEHIVEALCMLTHDVPELSGLTLLVRPMQSEMRRRRQALVRVSTANLRLTPRLLRAGLADGFDAKAFCRVLLAEGPLAGRALPVHGSATFEDPSYVRRLEPATRVEVEGGPDDGLSLRPDPGQVIGRYSSGGPAELTLYRGSACTDPGVSRAHLRWIGEGRAEALKRVVVLGDRIRGALPIHVDDRIRLGLATQLRGLA